MEKKESSETTSSSNNTAKTSLPPQSMVARSLPNANPTPNMSNAMHQQLVNQARTTPASNPLDAQRRTGQHLLSNGMPKMPSTIPNQSQNQQQQQQRLPPQMNLHYQQQRQHQHLPQHLVQQHMQAFSASTLKGMQNAATIKGMQQQQQQQQNHAANAAAARQINNTGNDRVTVDKAHKPLIAANMPAHSRAAAEEAVMRRIRALPPGHTSRLGGKLTYQPRPAHMAPPPHSNVNVPHPANLHQNLAAAAAAAAAANNNNQKATNNAAAAAAAARANLVNNVVANMNMAKHQQRAAGASPNNPAASLVPGVRPPPGNMMLKKQQNPKNMPKKSANATTTSTTSAHPSTATAKSPSSAAASAAKSNTAVTPIPMPSSSAIAAAAAAAQQPPVLDEATLIDEAIRYAREPLAEKYSPYIIPSDKTLMEARSRLKRAIEQTRQLRAAFSERVYGKYRVCLRPPPTMDQIMARIQSNPAATHQQLLDEIQQLKAEKEIEKKEAQKLNAEMTAANEQSADGKAATAAAVNAETAEQLMFISAGLSLIILPEQDVAGTIDMSGYPDRAPINPETGQRVRSISVAAAAAGEVMLDRARKGATMKMERQRRRQLQIMAGEDPEKEHPENTYSRLSLLTSTNTSTSAVVAASAAGAANKALLASKIATGKSAGATTTSASTAVTPSSATSMLHHSTFHHHHHHHHSLTPKSFKRHIGSAALQKPKANPTAPIISAKAIRARVQATMSNNTLLSLNPTAEELQPDGKHGAATSAMMELGVTGNKVSAQQQQQQRFRHPFPSSVGARRRAFLGTPQATNLNFAIPPIPTAKERRGIRKKPVKDTENVRTERATNAIQGVLQQYILGNQQQQQQQQKNNKEEQQTNNTFPPRKRRRTDISFLYGLEYPPPPPPEAKTKAAANNESKKKKEQPGIIDPMLTFNVLRAVGLIQPSSASDDTTGAASSSSSPLSIIDQSLLEFAEQRAMDSSPSRRSGSKLKKLTKKLVLAEQNGKDGEEQNTVLSMFFPKLEDETTKDVEGEAKDGSGSVKEKSGESAMGIDSDEKGKATVGNGVGDSTMKTAPAVAIRGGGSELPSTTEAKPPPVAGPINGKKTPEPNVPEKTNSQNGQRPMNLPSQAGNNAMHAKELASQQQRIAMMNQQLARADQNFRMGNAGHPNAMAQNGKAGNNGTRNNRMQGLPPDGFNRTGAAAMQMAHQFRHASASMQRLPGHPTGDLEAYIGNLHAQQGAAGYEWSQIAALGLNTHRAMVNFSAQDRARAIIAEQQNAAAAAAAQVAAAQRQQAVALMGGGFVPAGAPHFAQFSGRTAALINNSALMGHSGMAGVNQSAQMQAKKNENSNSRKDQGKTKERSDSDPKKSQKESKSSKPEESGRKRKLSTASSESGSSDKRRNVSSKSSFKRSDANGAAKAANGVQEGQKKGTKPRAQPKNAPRATNANKTTQNKSATGDPKQGSSIVGGRPEMPKMNKPPQTSGMQFYVPPAPAGIPSDMASLVLAAKVHSVIDAWENGEAVFDATTIIDFLLAVGIAVPIPKALVVNPLKERIGSTATKNNPFAHIPASSREVIVALILLWLWKHHEQCFQKAFAKSGRIDVDPECKWLINAAVDRSVSSLGKEITSTGSALSSALSLAKGKGGSSQKGAIQANDADRSQGRATRVDLLCASIVSRSLLEGSAIDDTMDKMLPNFHEMLEYLDECRKGSLHSKAQERALLAALISRKATMSLPFSHAYASSMVRAGEAIGHGELFEIVQNEDVKVSTMIPYDVFTDESGAWEDPCRPEGSFTKGLTGDDLMRRAHARAMIQKSLKKLQDRHSIKGGTPNSGAYTDPPNSNSNADSSKSPSGSGTSSGRGWGKRRSSLSEPKFPPGTGSAQATSMALYEPKHHSSPLEWDCDAPENLPYGNFSSTKSAGSGKRRTSQGGPDSGGKSPRGGNIVVRSKSVGSLNEAVPNSSFARSTHEISWNDIASVFESQNVQLPIKKKKKEPEETSISKHKTIYAPFVRQTESMPDYSDSESETEEDISDAMVLSRHQEVLDEMKEKLSDFLEARKKSVERKKKKDSLKKASN